MVWRVYEIVEYKGYTIKLSGNKLGYSGVWAHITKNGDMVDRKFSWLHSVALEKAKKVVDELYEFDLPFPIVTQETGAE